MAAGTGAPWANTTQEAGARRATDRLLKESLNLTVLQPYSTQGTTLDGRSEIPFTPAVSNMSTAEPVHRSGIVPGIIAASLFISFLLCLYAILWKCMVAMPRRQMKRQSRRRHSPGNLPEKTIC